MERRTPRAGASPLAIRPEDVAAAWGPTAYAVAPPFSPGAAWPECPIRDDPDGEQPANAVYATVREALRLLGLDAARYGTAGWNPLGGILRPGEAVVLKPNLVREFRETSADPADCVTTHGAVIRAVLDYAFLAVGPGGRIVIADAPHNDARFSELRRLAGLDEIQDLYRERLGFDVEVRDLRPERAEKIDGVIVGHVRLPGDPAGYVKVDLGRGSAFAEIPDLCPLLYGAEYERDEVCRHHHGDVQEYLIAGTILGADCVIGIPKLKTHKKVGLTVNLKNLVGINGNKNWLPHHREGTPAQGGDQFADDGLRHRLERALVARFKQVFPRLGPLRRAVAGPAKSLGRRIFGDTNVDTVRSGNWFGNDTAWRMVLDLNRILLHADATGRLHGHPVRRFFSVVDGIVGGEGNGPLDPTPRAAGLVLAGASPVAVDLAAARLMGFDRRRVPMLARALDEDHIYPLASFGFEDVRLRSNDARFDRRVADLRGPCLGFEPHFGWKGHIETGARDEARAHS